MWSPSVREWWIPMFACAISSKRAWYRVDLAQNIVVVRTMPGLASAACSALDSMDIRGWWAAWQAMTRNPHHGTTLPAEQFNREVHKLLK